jgi:hypothetical protein
MHQLGSLTKGLEPFMGRRKSLGVDVEADQHAIGRNALQDCCGMPAAPERSIHNDIARR